MSKDTSYTGLTSAPYLASCHRGCGYPTQFRKDSKPLCPTCNAKGETRWFSGVSTSGAHRGGRLNGREATMFICLCGGRHYPNANYYVSAVDGPRQVLLLGPFTTHGEALANVDAVRRRAEDLDCRAAFYAFGTVGMAPSHTKPGKLNAYMHS